MPKETEAVFSLKDPSEVEVEPIKIDLKIIHNSIGYIFLTDLYLISGDGISPVISQMKEASIIIT